MSSISDILSQYASSPAPTDTAAPMGTSQIVQNIVSYTTPDKQAQVTAASNQKKQDMGMSPTENYNALSGQMNGVGGASASQQEQDQRTLSPGQYMVKYGVDAYNQFSSGQAEAARSITSDVNASHNTDGVNTITDGIQGIGQGLVNSVVGIGALGAGLVDRDAGQSLSDSLNRFNDNVNANKSDSQEAGQRLVSALNANTERDNEALYKQDVKDDGSFIAGLKNIGRGAVDSVVNTATNPAALLDGTAQGVGSLLTAGPMAKALKALGSAVIPQATRRGVALAAALDTAAGTRSAATIATSAAEHAPILGSIGLMEAGGTYQQTNSDISQMSFDDLSKQSPAFAEMIKPVADGGQGMSKEDARSELANRSGLLAAAIQFPIAAATGSLVSKFEANPFAAKGVRTLLQNSGKETLEEGVQSATSQLATNYAEQQEALPNKEISQGVGQQLGQGALFGLTSTGVVSGPGSVARSAVRAPVDAAKAAYALGNRAVDAAKDSELLWNANTAVQAAANQVKSVVKPGIDWLAKRGDEAYRKMQETSPVSDANMETTARDVYNNAPENLQAAKEAVEQTDASPEEKAATNGYLDSLSGSLDFVADDYVETPDYVQKTVEGSSNQIEAMQRMAAFVNDEKNSPQERFLTGSILAAIINSSQEAIGKNASALANLPADHPAYQFATGIEDLHASFEKSQGLVKAQQAMDKMANNASTYDIVKPVDPETIDTPEGLDNVKAQVALATVAPDKVNPEDAKIILQQAKDGAISLNTKQSAALNVAISLVQSAREFDEQSQREGWSKADQTAHSLKVDDTEGSSQPSVLVLARRIYAAYASGDTEGATDALNHLMDLAVHMNGKVSTINSHLSDVANPDQNNALHYLQLQPDRSWKMTTGKNRIGVSPTKNGSVVFARRVAGEAQYVTNVANGLAQAFSDLGVKSLDHTSLDTRLTEGTTQQTADEFSNGTRRAGKSDTQTVAAQPSSTQAEQSDASIKPGDEVIWANKDHDLPVTYRGNDEVGPDGQTYSVVAYEGKPSYVLKSELRAKPEAKADPAPAPKTEQNTATYTNGEHLIYNGETVFYEGKEQTDANGNTTALVFQDTKAVRVNKNELSAYDHMAPINEGRGRTVAESRAFREMAARKVNEVIARYDENDGAYLKDPEYLAWHSALISDGITGDPNPSVEVVSDNFAPGMAYAKETNNPELYSYLQYALKRTMDKGIESLKPYKETSVRRPIFQSRLDAAQALLDTPFNGTKETTVKSAPVVSTVKSWTRESVSNDSDRVYLFGDNIADAQNGYVPSYTQAVIRGLPNAIGIPTKKNRGTQPGSFFTDADLEQFKPLVDAAIAEAKASGKDIVLPQDGIGTGKAQLAQRAPALAAYLNAALADLTGTKPEVVKVAEPTTVAEAYPNLATPDGGTNYFHDAFKLPNKKTSNTQGVENPLAAVNGALESDESLDSFSGSKRTNKLVPEVASAYQGMMQYAKGIVKSLNDILRGDIADQRKLDKPYLIPENPDVYKSVVGKSFNIIETGSNGSVRYNPELIQNAVLAGIQWVLTSYNQGANLDVEDIAKILGTDPADVSAEMFSAFNASMTTTEALRTLSTKISQYWGLADNRNDYDGFVKGIPASIAAEVLRAFEQAGLVETTTQEFEVVDAEGNVQPRKIDFTALKLDDTEDSKKLTDVLLQYPTAIEDAVMTDPGERRYTGDDRPPIAKTQMRNAAIENTPQQRDVLKNVQNTPYRMHMPMVGLFNYLGRDGVRDLFGEGDLENQVLNVNDRKGKKGRNDSFTAAFDELVSLQADMDNRLTDEDGDVGQIDIYYAYNFSRVNRLQMQGRYNPQASKLMREAVMPTGTEVDMSNPEMRMGFDLGLAQALGIKIHNMPHADAIAKLNELLTGKLAPAIQMLRDYHSTEELPDSAIEILRDALEDNGTVTPVSLQAISEYARFLNNEGNMFTTPMYVEADGVTNGIANATQMLSSGGFTQDYMVNSQRTGLFFGSEYTDLNTYRQQDSTDLYKATGIDLTTGLNSLKRNLVQTPAVLDQMGNMQGLLDMFLPGAVLDDQMNLKIDRGVTKNPLTITVYGSSQYGIAGNITDALINEIYAKMSDAAQAQANDPSLSFGEAMFGRGGETKFAQFAQYINALTTTEARYNQKEGYYYTKDTANNENSETSTPEAFTISKDDRNSIRANINTLFVTPMIESIEKTVGPSVMTNMTDIRMATQVISIFQQEAFRQAVEEEQALSLQSDPNYKKHYLLSQTTQQDILKSVTNTFPTIHTGTQSFFIGGANNGYNTNSTIGRSRDGKYRTLATMYGPTDAGVAGAAFMNIGMGDGQMIQYGFTGRDGVKRALPVFDGVNLAIDRLIRDSMKLNGAVFESWGQNPVSHVLSAFSTTIENSGVVDMSPDMIKALSRALTGDRNMLTTPAEIMREIKIIAGRMAIAERSIDARHETLRKFNLHIDQMASMAAPHQNKGEVLSNDLTEAAARLNEVYSDIMKGEGQPAPVKQEGTPAKELGVPSLGSKARTITMNMLNRLVKAMGLTGTKKAMFDEIRRSAAAKGYKIITGTREQLLAYNEANGTPHDPSEFTNLSVDGFISPNSKEIYIINATSQTLLHELVHATTFENILAHYQGNTTPEITQAVEALEGMMDQFLALDPFTMDAKTRTAYENAKAAIQGSRNNGDVSLALRRAAALNEFMAWSLATSSLSTLLEKTPILKRITDTVFNAIRKLVYGRKRIPAKPGDDILSNLMFHTGVIMRGQPTVQNISGDTKLYQSRIYGNNDRLQKLNDTFDSVVTAHINESADIQQKSNRQSEAAKALMNGNDVAYSFINHGFPMNMQQATTFSMIVSALSTQAHIDPASMNYAQELYDHVIDKLELGHFLPEAPWTQQDEYDATEKYNSIMGRYMQTTDVRNRSSLLPAFLALAMTDDGFRAVLNDIGLPENQKGDGTLDGNIEAFGTNLLDALGRRMAGDTQSANVLQAVDALTDQISDIAQNRESFIDQYAGPLGNIIDRANEIVSNALEALSDALWEGADKVKTLTSNKTITALANATKMFAAIASEQKAGIISEGVSTTINNLNGMQALRDVIGDIVGRTATNKDVYDLIKRFRTAIQQDRQQFRDVLPGIIAQKFSRELTDKEWSTLHHALAKTDIVSLFDHYTTDEIHALMKDGRTLRGKITALENRIGANASKQHSALIKKKALQLAQFMMGGEPGQNLLRNAEAIGRLLGETDKAYSSTTDMVKDIDALVSLYAIEQLTREQRDTVFSLVQSEESGMDFVMSYLKGQRAEEQRKLNDSPAAKFNGYKGYIPSVRDSGVTLIVAEDSESAKLESMSMKRIGDYQGSSAEPGKVKRGYYFGNVQSRTMFNQGLMQNVRQTANGVDTVNGFTQDSLAGRITDRATVKTITARMRAGETGQNLLPVYNDRGQVIAYERTLDRNIQQKTNPSTHLAKMIGVWRGRQVEEVKGAAYNMVLIDTLSDMYHNEIKGTPSKQSEYVDVLSDRLDPVLADAVKLMPKEVRDYARSLFGDAFYVRKDLLNDTFGYREATIGDAWTGNARWSPETLSTAKRVAMGIFGADAYRIFTKAESLVQNFVQDARTLIIVKSVVVPFANAMSNVLQLVGRGVPIRHITAGVPRKLAEINTYVKTRALEVEAEADLRAAENDPREQRRLHSKIQGFRDSYRRMSIWPLLEAGEFSAIHDASVGDTVELTSGKLNSFIEQQVDKLPKSMQTAGRYALVTKDTALFKALEKSVEYGDFVAKAILFDDITRRQKKSVAEGLAAVTEEFVNYDRLPGRFRGYMEKTGLLWFYNYKVRSVKVALSTIRNNPLHALLAGNMPLPDMFGNIGSPVSDNLITQMSDGGLNYSVGMGQAFNAPFLNPWVNLAH